MLSKFGSIDPALLLFQYYSQCTTIRVRLLRWSRLGMKMVSYIEKFSSSDAMLLDFTDYNTV